MFSVQFKELSSWFWRQTCMNIFVVKNDWILTRRKWLFTHVQSIRSLCRRNGTRLEMQISGSWAARGTRRQTLVRYRTLWNLQKARHLITNTFESDANAEDAVKLIKIICELAFKRSSLHRYLRGKRLEAAVSQPIGLGWEGRRPIVTVENGRRGRTQAAHGGWYPAAADWDRHQWSKYICWHLTLYFWLVCASVAYFYSPIVCQTLSPSSLSQLSLRLFSLSPSSSLPPLSLSLSLSLLSPPSSLSLLPLSHFLYFSPSACVYFSFSSRTDIKANFQRHIHIKKKNTVLYGIVHMYIIKHMLAIQEEMNFLALYRGFFLDLTDKAICLQNNVYCAILNKTEGC